MRFKPAFTSPSPNIFGPIENGIWRYEYVCWVLALMGCMERLVRKTKWGEKSWCRHFWPDWHSSLRRVIHSERKAQVLPLLLPAQVYDNPNKLWCTAQTLITLIGTKSNPLCLSGHIEWLRVLSPSPTIHFSLSSNPTSLQVHIPIPLFSVLFSAPMFLSFCLSFLSRNFYKRKSVTILKDKGVDVFLPLPFSPSFFNVNQTSIY